MNKIEMFEVSLDEARKIKRLGFSDCFGAYDEAKEVSYDHFIFKEVLWEDRLSGMVDIMREAGIEKFVITVRQSGIADIIFQLQELGCRLGDAVKVPTPHSDYDGRTDAMVRKYVNGFEISL